MNYESSQSFLKNHLFWERVILALGMLEELAVEVVSKGVAYTAYGEHRLDIHVLDLDQNKNNKGI